MPEKITFACGEFIPGKERIGAPGIKPPSPPYLIAEPSPWIGPGLPKPVPIEEEWVCICTASLGKVKAGCCTETDRKCIKKVSLPPGMKSTRSFLSKTECETTGFGETPCHICGTECKTISTQYCPDGRTIKLIDKECIDCGPARNRPPNCVYDTQAQCILNCVDVVGQCPEPARPGQPGIPAPITPRPPIGGGRGPETPISVYEVFECIVAPVLCPDGRTIKQIARTCRSCGKNTDPGQRCTMTALDCKNNCKSSQEFECPGPITPRGPDVINPGVPINPDSRGGSGGGGGVLGGGTLVPSLIEQINKPSDIFGVTKPRVVINIEQEAANVTTSKTEDRSNTTYHPQYNFFKYSSNEETTLVPNTNYLNIFKNTIPKEVEYVLRVTGSTQPWKEFPYYQITKDKLAYSLRDDLFFAFNNILDITGQEVSLDYFLQMVLNLMVTNRLQELDPTYFIQLAKKQQNEDRVVYVKSNSKGTQEKAALGIISDEAISADPANSEGIQKRQLLRSKRLNEDLDAFIPLESFTAAVIEPLPLPNAGLEIATYNAGPVLSTGVVPLGEGDGYYISALTLNGVEPIYIETALSATFYMPQATRQKALEMFNVDYAITLAASSEFSNSEFGPSFNVTGFGSSALYFELNLSSIDSLDKVNSMVNSISGEYTLLSPTDASAHSMTYGFAATRVNIDFRDPLYLYAARAGKLDFRLNDIDFKSLIPNRNSSDKILSKSIPFALILVPGCGSKHNPFGTISRLVNFESGVRRELRVIPGVDKISSEQEFPELEEVNLYDVVGAYRLGLIGELDTQNIVYIFDPSSSKYQNTYFSGSYLTDTPTRTELIPGRLVNTIIENIKAYELDYNLYGVSSITWWDVFRRLKAEEFAGLGVYAPNKLFTALENGWREIKIRDVLNRMDDEETGILSDETDTIYLNPEDRLNATSY